MAKFRTDHYSVEELGDGVYAAIARREGWGVCNSALVELGGGPVVFDTSCTPDSALDLSAISTRTLGRPPALAALSHWHLDHSIGTQEFPNVPVWGTRRTREILLETRTQLEAELARDQLEAGIQEVEGHRDEMRSEGARSDLEFCLVFLRALLRASGRVRITPPDHAFEKRLELPGARAAQLLSFGSGHTQADAVLFLPHEKVLFTGDLAICGVQPSMGSGDPEHWLQVLDELDRLGAERVVPGHGPVLGPDGTEEVRAYVGGVLRAAQQPETAPLPAAIQRWEGSLSLTENLRFARGWLEARRNGR